MPQLVTVNEVKLVLGLTGAASDLYPDEMIEQVIDAAEEAIFPFITDSAIEMGRASVREAIIAVTIDIWQNRQAPGGAVSGVDFQPAPYRMGRSLLSKVSGLLGVWYKTNWQVG